MSSVLWRSTVGGVRAVSKNVSGSGVRALSGPWGSSAARSASTSSGPAAGTTETSHVENKDIQFSSVRNRNPRNLEKLRIAEKPSGWDLEKPGRKFWNKLTIELSGRYITCKIHHFHGQVPVTASSKEWCVKRFLYNTRDDIAAKTVGKVLAYRCLQLGITEVACFISEEDRKKPKISLILQAFQDGGVSLEEPDQANLFLPLDDTRMPENTCDVYEDINEKLEEFEKLKRK